jgi:hypothetical protein
LLVSRLFPKLCAKVHVAGAHIGFAGAIWIGSPQLQVLCHTLPLFYHKADINMRMQTARILGATKNAILALKSYYETEFPRTPDRLPNLDVPHRTHFTSLDGTKHTFQYTYPLDKDKLLFCGTIGDDKIFIKFVYRYSVDAHRKCRELGFAPDLKGFNRLPGGWYIVVMDFIGDTYMNWSVRVQRPHSKRKSEQRWLLSTKRDMCMVTFELPTSW